jgi:nucleotide-binding universal stress UspA family protein
MRKKKSPVPRVSRQSKTPQLEEVATMGNLGLTIPVRAGSRLALQFHANLVVAHIVPSFTGNTNAFSDAVLELERHVFAETEARLPDEIPASYRSRLSTQPIVRAGDIRDEFLSIVESEKIDLVVMGTHGRGALERLFLSSIAENMLRKSPVPIVTVSQRFEESGKPSSGCGF